MNFLSRLTKVTSVLFGSSESNETPSAINKYPQTSVFNQFPNTWGSSDIIEESDYDILFDSTPPAIQRQKLSFEKLKFGDFPTIEEKNIKNNENLIAVKEKYVKLAFDAIRPYYDYVLHLPPISMNEEYSKCLLHIIARMIAIYWDMPASRSHHDSGDFGLLRHAIHTGTREAQRLCYTNKYSEIAGIDSEGTRKLRPKYILCGFIIGMFHDADKMLQLQLICNLGSGPNIFNPLHGSGAVLDYKLKYPRDKMKLEWMQSEHKSLNMGLHYLYSPVVPAIFRKSLDGEILEFIYTCLKNYKSRADQVASQFSQEQDKYLNEIRIGLIRMLSPEDVINGIDSHIFKMGNNWYMTIQDRFIADLNTELRATENAVERVLIDNGILKTRKHNDYNGHRFSVSLIFPGARYEKKYMVSFYQSSFIDSLPVISERRIGLAPIRINATNADFLKSVGIDLPSALFVGNKSTQEKGTATREEASPPPATPDTQKEPAPPVAHTTAEKPLDAKAPPASPKRKKGQETANADCTDTQKQEQQPLPIMGEATMAQTPANDKVKQQPKTPVTRKNFEAQAAHEIKENVEYQDIPYLNAERVQAYHAQFKPAFFNVLPNIDRVLAESLANGIGAAVPNNSTFPAMHLQSTISPKTIFYIQQNRTLLARHPSVIKFAWGIMMHQHQNGEHGWLAGIPELPLVVNGTEHISNLLIGYVYLAWARKGLLIPEGTRHVFNLSDHLIPVLGKKGSDNSSSVEKISGKFISLDLDALLSCETNRIGSKSFENVLRYHYLSLYKSEWA